MYKNYIFDLYGTLIDIKTDETKPEFWKKVSKLYADNGAQYTFIELENKYSELVKKEKEKIYNKYPQYEYIDINLENVFAGLYMLKGVNADSKLVLSTAKKFREYSTLFIRLYDGVLDLLKTLKSKGKKVYLLSNAQRCFTFDEIVKTGILDYFDGIVISSDVNCAKPDKFIYNYLIEKYGLKNSESIMIGNDYLCDIKGAHQVNIDSLYIHQSISPEIKGELYCKWSIMDGDVYKIKDAIIN